jgi:uncharacterized protein (DUF3084 family)
VTEEVLKVSITVFGSIVVAGLGGWFATRPKPKVLAVEGGTTIPAPPNADPALLVWVQRVMDERIADVVKQRDDAIEQRDMALERAERAEGERDAAEHELGLLRQEVSDLRTEVAELKEQLNRPADARTRASDGEAI